MYRSKFNYFEYGVGAFHAPPAANTLIPNEVTLGRIPCSCKAEGKCRVAFEISTPSKAILQK